MFLRNKNCDNQQINKFQSTILRSTFLNFRIAIAFHPFSNEMRKFQVIAGNIRSTRTLNRVKSLKKSFDRKNESIQSIRTVSRLFITHNRLLKTHTSSTCIFQCKFNQ